MRTPGMWRLLTLIALVGAPATSAVAQQAEAPTREAAIVQEQAEKTKTLQPYEPGKIESFFNRADRAMVTGLRLHPFFTSAYSGGGFTLGVGYAFPMSAYSVLDVRGSYTITNYKRIEAEFRAPRSNPGRILGNRDDYVSRRPHQLPLPPAVRVGDACGLAIAPLSDAAWRGRAVRVVATLRRGNIPLRGDCVHA